MTAYALKFTAVLIVPCCLLLGCFSSGPSGFGDVHGQVRVNSEPVPQGTRICFQHQDDASIAFFAIVDDAGRYSYRPPQEAPLKEGEYCISLQAIATTTTVDSTGLAIETSNRGAANKYGKYSDPAASELVATLTTSSVEYDIEIASP